MNTPTLQQLTATLAEWMLTWPEEITDVLVTVGIVYFTYREARYSALLDSKTGAVVKKSIRPHYGST